MKFLGRKSIFLTNIFLSKFRPRILDFLGLNFTLHNFVNFTKKVFFFHSFTQKSENVESFIEPKWQFRKKKWKCSHLWWFQNDAWFFMKNISSMVILKTVEKSLFLCHSFTETVKLVTENWSWIVYFYSIFDHIAKIMTKKFIPDFRWRRLQARKQN